MAYLGQQALQFLRAVSIVHHQLDQRCTGLSPGTAQGRIKRFPAFRAMVFQAEHRRGVFKLHVLGHQIETLTFALRGGQQGENLSTVVVNHNQHKRCRNLTQQRQGIEIVQRGEIANDCQRRLRAGTLYARRRGDQPVNAAGPPVTVDRVTGWQL